MKKRNIRIKAKIESLGYCAEGIGRISEGENTGMTVFINNTAPNDTVEAEVYTIKKNFCKAQLIDIIEKGDSRIKPECALARVCGGCQWQHVEYETQLEAKTSVVKDQMAKLAGISPEKVRNIIANPSPFNYRAKVQYPLQITKKSKRLLVGYYKIKTHELVNIKYCPVQPEIFNSIIEKLRELYGKYNLSIYNETTQKGYLRHFILRQSYSNNEIIATIVVNSGSIDDRLISLAKDLQEKFPQITGVTANFNKTKTNVILADKSKILVGKDFIIETIGEKQYHICDRSFFQVNPPVAKLMLDFIREIIIQNNPSGVLVDIYAGIGAISTYVSDLFKKTISIENAPSARLDAEITFELNNIKNTEYIHKDALSGFNEIVSKSEIKWIIVDPPRQGCEKELLEEIGKLNNLNLIYISCNPSTQARDLAILKDYGFIIELIQPFDMFSHTFHVESIAYLKKND